MRTIRFLLVYIVFAFPLIVDAQSNPKLEVANGHREGILIGAASSDDRLLATSDWNGMVIWDLASGLALKTVKRAQRYDMPFTIPNSRNLGSIHDGVIRVFDAETLQERVVANITLYFIVKNYVVDKSGRYLYIGGTRYDAGITAVLYRIDLQQNRADLMQELKGSSIGITGSNHVSGLEFSNLTLNPDGSKLCARLDVHFTNAPKPTNNYAVYNTQTFQKEKEWNAPDQMMGFISNDLFWHMGKTLLNSPITAVDKKGNINLVRYPSLQLIKTLETDFSGFPTLSNGTNSIQMFDEPSRTWYLASKKGLTIVDVAGQTARTVITDTTSAYVAYGGILLPASKKLVQGNATGALVVVDPANKSRRPLGGGQPIRVSAFTSNPKRPVLSIHSYSQDAAQFIDLRNDAVKVINHKLKSSSPITWSPDGRWAMAFEQYSSKLSIFDANNLSAAPRVISPRATGYHNKIVWSPNGKQLVLGPSGGIDIFDATTFQLTRTLPGTKGYVGGDFAFSSDGSKIVTYTLRPNTTSAATTSNAEKWMACYNVSDGRQIWEIRSPTIHDLYGLSFIDNDRRIFATDGNNNVYSFDAPTGALQRTNNLKLESWQGAPSIDAKLYFAPFEKSLAAIDKQTGTMLYAIPNSNNEVTGYTAALAGGEFVASVNSDNSIHIYDLKRKLDIGRLFTFASNEEYALVSTQNFFEGSQQATAAMYFIKDNRILPLQSLFEKFYTPKLLQRLLTRTEPGPPVININTIKGAPTASISYTLGKRNLTVEDDTPAGNTITQSNVTITVKATAPGDAINEIRLFQNGKLIANNTRNLSVADDEGLDQRTYEVTLQPGSNHFSAISINSQRTESMPAQLSLSFKDKPAGGNASNTVGNTKTAAGTTMHLVVIGINTYKNPRYNLNYAVADAKGFQEKINGSCGTLLQSCKPYFISNDQATKENIVKTMQKIAAEAAPQDMLVFYYAGHGVMNEAQQKEFFLVPYDVTQLYGNDAGLAAKGISSSELQKISTTIKAQKQLFILDACQSAGALQQIAMRGAAEEKAIAQLARSTGTHWLTASGSDQFASEFDKLGHGAFTYVLINGLAGEAALGGSSITVNGLKAYIESKVPEITEKYKGSAQYPASYGFGQDFPIAIKK